MDYGHSPATHLSQDRFGNRRVYNPQQEQSQADWTVKLIPVPAMAGVVEQSGVIRSGGRATQPQR